MVDCLKGTPELHLTLRMQRGVSVAKLFVDASFAVHDDFRSHTGSCLILEEGAVISKSSKQKLNMHSSTEAKLMGCNDAISNVLWTSRFWRCKHLAPSAMLYFRIIRALCFWRKKCFQALESACVISTSGIFSSRTMWIKGK